jgi:soluble lytic murein transglycosylase-like protein
MGVLAAFALLLGTAVPARAQIYSWRDADGRLFLSDHRPADGVAVQSYSVPNTTEIRTTRFAPAGNLGPYDDLIVEHAARNGVRADLVRAVMRVESAFDPRAVSAKGAAGLMQLMPATMRRYGVANPFDPSENIAAGVAYLRDLLDRYRNDETLALAAYNAGPDAVDRHGQTVPPYRETRQYVSTINQMAGTPSPTDLRARDHGIYKVTETVDGQEVVRYTDKRPSGGNFVIVSRWKEP